MKQRSVALQNMPLKKIQLSKSERQINSNLLCKFDYFWKKVEFLGAQNAPSERSQRPNAIWCEMKFYDHHFF